MNKICYFLCICLSAMVWSACNTTSKELVQFTQTKDSAVYQLTADTASPTCRVNVEMEYPTKYSNTVTLHKLEQIFTGFLMGDRYTIYPPQEAVKKYIEDYIADYKLVGAEFKTPNEYSGEWLNYEQKTSLKLLYNSPQYISMAADYFSYTGGAHPMTTKKYIVISLADTSVLQISDLIDEHNMEAVKELIVETMSDTKEWGGDLKKMEEVGYDMGAIEPTNNFYINETGITWHYDPYEIAPYYLGSTDILVPYTKLTPYLKYEPK